MSGWEPVLTGARGDAARQAAREVGRRISDSARVREAVHAAHSQTSFPRSARWVPYDVAQGDAGLALAFGYLDRCFPGAGWDSVAHRSLASAVLAADGKRLAPGLFSGLAGLGFVAMALSRNRSRYRRLAAAIDVELVTDTHVLAQTVRGRTGGLAVQEFDVIAGLAGISAYLLADWTSPPRGAALKHALQALVDLVSDAGPSAQRWLTPPDLLFDEEVAACYPYGNLNCGLAHGIPGPMAVMAVALSQGFPVPGLREAVERCAAWLLSHRCDDPWGVNWPAMVRLPESDEACDAPTRAAWCYGSPGVARALWLAGTALDEPGLRALAIEAMQSVYRRPIPARNVDSPTFCHGIAGLLQITLRFHHDTRLPVFATAAADLTDQLLDAYEPDDSFLGFRAVEHDGRRVDQAGLLEGATGVGMVLLAASTAAEPSWDRLFLLS